MFCISSTTKQRTYYSVVIDYPKDEDNVSTGRFELVYEKDFTWIGNPEIFPYQFPHESNL